VYALTDPWPPPRHGLLSGMPLPMLIVLGALTAGVGTLAATGLVPLTPARAVGAGGAQGALLATAVAWARCDPRSRPAPALAAAVVLVGAVGAALSPFGVVAYLAAPVWLWRQRARLARLGLAHPPLGVCVGGAALGALLGAHLLLTASLTLGYGVRVPTTAHLLPWLAYDAGANVLTTEAFFRGALLDRAQRRWPFAPAAAFVTVVCLARYFVDPLLPRSLEVTAGAVFYLTLLSLANCWMYWRSGSIVPGVAAGVAFFSCYRLLHVVP
jgi:membrane protease YdiL (CAAX protease family)